MWCLYRLGMEKKRGMIGGMEDRMKRVKGRKEGWYFV